MTLTAKILVGIWTSVFAITAQAGEFKENNSIRYVKTCEAAANNDVSALKRLLRIEPYGKQHIVDNVRCNDMSITEFAASNYAVETTALLSRYAEKKQRLAAQAILDNSTAIASR
ncbi:DUF3718 domain-containing protein [Thalassotalea sp. HSM 43]|uniref:DUF3718 domain-containing protein n=1 Tax=Thalassotalea sp. HSM 43 TaxID=2552945 RepID=UPI001080BC68|nr:DUF3718 domain-containing protein [Thalassotalea sp. HSM 43]QBY04597.1 DUF3718 domain-containing protein [Thalassotalea sp. HSM 43]